MSREIQPANIIIGHKAVEQSAKYFFLQNMNKEFIDKFSPITIIGAQAKKNMYNVREQIRGFKKYGRKTIFGFKYQQSLQ